MNSILKAGMVIVRHGVSEPEVLLIFSGKRKDWSFPKGHCEAGESFEQTALRETQEETGLSINIVQQLPTIIYQYPEGGSVTLEMFLGIPSDKDQKERTEYDSDQLEWVPVSRIEEKLSYENLKKFFRENRETILNMK